MKKAALLILLFFLHLSLFSVKVDSLLKILRTTKNDTVKIQASIDLSHHYRNFNSDSAFIFCKIAESCFKQNTPVYWKSKIFLAYASLYSYSIGDFKTAEQYYQSALKFAMQSKNIRLIGDVYLTGGSINGSEGNYKKAITCFLKAEKYYQQGKYLPGVSSVYNNLGVINYNQQEYSQALSYYKKALEIKKKKNEPEDLAAAYQNISGVYYDINKLDSALYYIALGLEINRKSKDDIGAAMACSGKAMILRKLNRFDESLKSEEECRELALKTGDKWTLANSYHGSALIYQNKKNYNKAINNFLESIKLNKEIGAKKELSEGYEAIAQTYKQMNNYKLAFDYFYKFAVLKDSVIGENVRKSLKDVEAKYASEKKEKEIALLNKAKTQDSLKIVLKDMEGKEKDLQIEKRRGQVKYLFVIAILLAGFGIWIFYALRNKQKANIIIQQQKKDVEQQKHLVDEKQKEIIDSINYAKRIQNSLLAPLNYINENIPENFVLFKPKDIVSGDFYWTTSAIGPQSDKLFFLAVCDSTGHGVPGAFMSLLNIGFLSEAINEKNILEPNKIFDYVRSRLIESISAEGQKDGFDGILICMNIQTKQITYAAANNAPLLVSKNIIKRLPCDKMPVGKGEKETGFSLYSADCEPDDSLYLFTDGYPDQFGGPKGKKFKYKQLEELIFMNSNNSMEEQKQKLHESFEAWRGKLEQVDDVCVIGLQL